MTPAPRRVLVFLIAVVAGIAALAVITSRHRSEIGPRPPAERQPLMLLSSLPLVFGEDFSLKSTGSPLLAKLQTRYAVILISVTSGQELSKARILLMAQPQAQTPENLVALDSWVRGGGRVLLFSDPLLEWPSKRPLGDMLRPPPVFADTGLLAHWGLRLDPPAQRGPATRNLAGFNVLTVSPGKVSGACAISRDGLVASCRIGAGTAVIVADADLLDTAVLGPTSDHNLDAVLRALARLEHS
jgi:hypothetical protein